MTRSVHGALGGTTQPRSKSTAAPIQQSTSAINSPRVVSRAQNKARARSTAHASTASNSMSKSVHGSLISDDAKTKPQRAVSATRANTERKTPPKAQAQKAKTETKPPLAPVQRRKVQTEAKEKTKKTTPERSASQPKPRSSSAASRTAPRTAQKAKDSIKSPPSTPPDNKRIRQSTNKKIEATEKATNAQPAINQPPTEPTPSLPQPPLDSIAEVMDTSKPVDEPARSIDLMATPAEPITIALVMSMKPLNQQPESSQPMQPIATEEPAPTVTQTPVKAADTEETTKPVPEVSLVALFVYAGAPMTEGEWARGKALNVFAASLAVRDRACVCATLS